MLDTLLRPIINPLLDNIAIQLSKTSLTANRLTWLGFAFGITGCFFAGFQVYVAGLFFILLGRVCDLLDGPLARAKGGANDFGGYLDILLDFIVYAAFPVMFALGQPHHASAAAFLLFSYMGTSTAFLAFAAIAAKRGIESTQTGEKSFFHQGGLVGATETVLFIIVCCLMPAAFSAFAVIFGVMCWITTVQRLLQAYRVLS